MHSLGINAGELRGNRLTQVHLEMMAVKMECVREGNVLWCKVLGNFTAKGMTGTRGYVGIPQGWMQMLREWKEVSSDSLQECERNAQIKAHFDVMLLLLCLRQQKESIIKFIF